MNSPLGKNFAALLVVKSSSCAGQRDAIAGRGRHFANAISAIFLAAADADGGAGLRTGRERWDKNGFWFRVHILANGVSDAFPFKFSLRSFELRKRERVAIRIFEPRHERSARGMPDSVGVLVHAFISFEDDSRSVQTLNGLANVRD